MTREEQLQSAERQAFELMPWYVNGTLAGEEREFVRRELLHSLSCRKEYEFLRRLQQGIQGEDRNAVATERAFDRLMARIPAGTRSQAAAGQRPKMPPLRFTIAQAALLLVLAAAPAAWWYLSQQAAPGLYETLSVPTPIAPGETYIRVVLAPGVPEATLRDLLVEHPLTRIGEATEHGIYTLAVTHGTDVDSLIARLKADPRLSFVSSPTVAGE